MAHRHRPRIDGDPALIRSRRFPFKFSEQDRQDHTWQDLQEKIEIYHISYPAHPVPYLDSELLLFS